MSNDPQLAQKKIGRINPYQYPPRRYASRRISVIQIFFYTTLPITQMLFLETLKGVQKQTGMPSPF